MAVPGRSEKLICLVIVRGYAELARLGGVSRARMTQIMHLLNLAHEVQEKILFRPKLEGGQELLAEQQIRSMKTTLDWNAQKRQWTGAVNRAMRQGTLH